MCHGKNIKVSVSPGFAERRVHTVKNFLLRRKTFTFLIANLRKVKEIDQYSDALVVTCPYIPSSNLFPHSKTIGTKIAMVR